MRKIPAAHTLTLYTKSNYRAILNRKLDYGATRSNYMSRQSASSPSRSNTAANLRFKSGDLNNVHLDRTALSHAFQLENNENAASPWKKPTLKHRMKNEKNSHHNSGYKNNNGQHKHSDSQCAINYSAQQIRTAPYHPKTDFEVAKTYLGYESGTDQRKKMSACAVPFRKVKVRSSCLYGTSADQNRTPYHLCHRHFRTSLYYYQRDTLIRPPAG
jgi:hypothetical protein